MRKILLTFAVLAIALTAQSQDFESAASAVKNMGIGWNLGNCLEANSQSNSDPSSDAYWGQQDLSSETCWGQSPATKELITMMKDAGFSAIRVPVTWYNHMDKDGNVNAEWMARVHEVVDYVIDNGMYCIVNVHHDTGANSSTWKSWLHADAASYTTNKARYEKLWKQIATEFKDYDQHLVFESYNEMLDQYSSWCFASFNSSNKYNASDASASYDAINNYAQSFVNTVRSTGGNNANRNLIVNTYGACCGSGNWNSHLKDPLKYLTIPADNASGHIAVEVHDYPNIEGDMSSIQSECNDMFNGLNTYFVSKGIPVIIGEWGTSNVDKGDGKTDYDRYRQKMLDFADYFVKKAKSMNIATFYWMGLSDGIYRSFPAFNQPDLAEKIVKAFRGDDFEGVYPTIGNVDDITLWSGSQQLEWGTSVSIPASVFSDENKDKYIELVYEQNFSQLNDKYDDIQFFYGDWNGHPSFTVDGKSFTGDFSPSSFYSTPSGTEHTTAFRFTSDSYSILGQRGLIIHGHGVMLKEVRLVSSPSTGIASVNMNVNASSDEHDARVYDLQGRRVMNPSHPGIYIRNGKKFIVR